MRVFIFEEWRYKFDEKVERGRHYDEDGVFACQTCDQEKGVMYVLADKWEDVEGLIDTESGQQCGECLAQTLTEPIFNSKEGTRLHWNVNRG